uniref:Btz domain-containing protein n=1 Tax=Steinernema glaseri TaxID=37863 RepID=A0A1I7YQR1_9BILA
MSYRSRDDRSREDRPREDRSRDDRSRDDRSGQDRRAGHRPDFSNRRPAFSRDFRGRAFDTRPRQRHGVSQTVNELDKESIVGASGGARRGFSFGNRGGRVSFDRPSNRGRDFRSARQEPYGARNEPHGRPSRGGRDHQSAHPREQEHDRERHEDSSRPTMNIFDPAVVPNKGFYYEHDNRGGDYVKRDYQRRGDGDRYGRGRERDSYDTRRQTRDVDRSPLPERSAPDGWRNNKSWKEHHPNDRQGNGKPFDRSRLSSRADGKWTHDMFEEVQREES